MSVAEVRMRPMIFSAYVASHKAAIAQRPAMLWICHYTPWCYAVGISRWVVLSLLKTGIMLVIRLNRFSLVVLGEE